MEALSFECNVYFNVVTKSRLSVFDQSLYHMNNKTNIPIIYDANLQGDIFKNINNAKTLTMAREIFRIHHFVQIVIYVHVMHKRFAFNDCYTNNARLLFKLSITKDNSTV